MKGPLALNVAELLFVTVNLFGPLSLIKSAALVTFNNKEVFATAGNMLVGGVKLAVYNAVPLITRKLEI